MTKRQYTLRRNALQKKIDEYRETLDYWYRQAQIAERQKYEWDRKIDEIYGDVAILNSEYEQSGQKKKVKK